MSATAVTERTPLHPDDPYQERFGRLNVTEIVPSSTNPRTHFDPAKIAELSRSIAEKGVIEPIVVRPRGGKVPGWEIVAGECRYRAAKMAEIQTLPAIIRNYTDEQALEIQLVENLHRNDLTALEQAHGYRALIDANPTKHSAESIATRIGMSPAWVWDRLKLLDLVPEAAALLEQGTIAVGHAILIARQKPADQQRIIAVDDGKGFRKDHGGLWQDTSAHLPDDGRKPGKYDDVKAVSVRELERWIADHIRFDVTHAAKAVPLEFEATAAVVDQAAAQPGRGKKVIPITFSYHVQEDARDPNERTYGRQSWERADGFYKSKTCEYSALGVVVAGSEHYGKTFQVCINRDKCRVHFGAVIKQREKNQQLRATGKPKKAAANEEATRKREAQALEIQRTKEARWKALKPALEKASLAAIAKQKAVSPTLFKAMLAEFGLPASTTLKTLPKALLALAVTRAFRDVYFWGDKDAKELLVWPKRLGVDVQACEPKAAKSDEAA